MDRESNYAKKVLSGVPSRLHFDGREYFEVGWGMLVDPETCPCDKVQAEWLNRLVTELEVHIAHLFWSFQIFGGSECA
jgi:hypothetical protein